MVLKKCELFEVNINLLELHNEKDGLIENPGTIEVFRTWPMQTSVTDIRRLVKLAQFFRRLIPDFAKFPILLTDMTKHGSGVHK